MYLRRMEILVPSEFHERSGTGSEGCVQQVGELPANIARNDMLWEPVEWRLPSQMNCRKVWDRALTAVRGRSEFLLLIIARANQPLMSLYGTFVRAVNFTRERTLPINAIRGNHCLINHNMQNQLSELCKI